MCGSELIQTDKKYSQLKLKQKEKIAEWMFQETKAYYEKNCTFPGEKNLDEVVSCVYSRIEEGQIWIPYKEVLRHYKKKRSDINSRVKRAFNQYEEKREEKACLMNMCMIQDERGNVLALDKVNDSYTGTTFPGGHVEKGEIFQNSVIREVWEETGLKIKNPLLCGVYHWIRSGIHNIIFLYKTNEFSGELKSSGEGRVYWVSLEEFRKKELAVGMEYVLKIMDSPEICECFMHLENGKYVGNINK